MLKQLQNLAATLFFTLSIITIIFCIKFSSSHPNLYVSENYREDLAFKFYSLKKELNTKSKFRKLIFIGNSTCAQGISAHLINKWLDQHAQKIKVFNFCQEGDSHPQISISLRNRISRLFPEENFTFVLFNFYEEIDPGFVDFDYRMSFYDKYEIDNKKRVNLYLRMVNFIRSINHEINQMFLTGIARNPLKQNLHVHQFKEVGDYLETSTFYPSIQAQYLSEFILDIIFFKVFFAFATSNHPEITRNVRSSELNKYTYFVNLPRSRQYNWMFSFFAKPNSKKVVPFWIDLTGKISGINISFSDPLHYDSRTSIFISESIAEWIKKLSAIRPQK